MSIAKQVASERSEQLVAGSGRVGPLSVAGHELTLFEHSQPLIEAMIRDIAAAKKRVWLESYILAGDAAGRAVVAALAERARAGVEVRLMYDSFGSLSTPDSLFNELRAAGGQVHAYHTLKDALWRWAFLRILNRRNHRKLLVVDDRVAYFGGMNIVDQSGIRTVADAKARHLPASAGWRDLHVRMNGPQTAEVAAAMDRLWRRVKQREKLAWPPWPIAKMLASPPETIDFFDFRPTHKERRAHRVFVPLILSAEHEIVLAMAYFVPVGRVLRELLRARRRGVTVRVIVPQESDVRIVRWASRHFYAYLLRRGIRIYERRDQMLHSKVMVVDSRWSVIGSCNLDPRSLRINLEFIGVLQSPALAEIVRQVCLYEIQHSDRVLLEHWRRRTVWQRLGDRVAWSFRRFL